jgi:hypothetical protein
MPCTVTRSAVLLTVTGPYQAVWWQQNPKYLLASLHLCKVSDVPAVTKSVIIHTVSGSHQNVW